MRIINYDCPECNTKVTLYLASNPLMLVVDCPECQTTILHSENEIYNVDNDKIKNMNTPQIKKYIKELKQDKEPNIVKTFVKVQSKKPKRENVIQENEISDLKAYGGITEDVNDFIERM